VVVNGRILGVSVIPLQTDSEFDGWRGLFERGEDYDGPESFGGYSGGGLWQNLIEEKDGQIHWTRSLLSGVAFHQSRFKDNRNIVRFSGRRCIYEDLVNALRT
jgi:hypothetical protein